MKIHQMIISTMTNQKMRSEEGRSENEVYVSQIPFYQCKKIPCLLRFLRGKQQHIKATGLGRRPLSAVAIKALVNIYHPAVVSFAETLYIKNASHIKEAISQK